MPRLLITITMIVYRFTFDKYNDLRFVKPQVLCALLTDFPPRNLAEGNASASIFYKLEIIYSLFTHLPKNL